MGTNHSSPTINTETNTDLAHDLLNNNSVKRQTSDQPVESHLRSTGRAESRTGRRSKSAERPRLNITATSSRSSPSTPTLLTRRRVHSPPATLAVDSIILDRKSNNSSKSSGKRRTKKSPQSILLADDGPYYRLTRCSDDEVSFHREKTELLLEAVNTSPAAAIASQSRGSLISPLKLDLMCETESRLHFKIYDPHNKRFEVQESMLGHSLPEFTKKAHHTQYSVEYSRRPFGLTVTRKSTGFVIFNSCEVGKLQFNDEKIQFSTSVLSRYLYGLGEHQKTFLIDTHNHSHNFVFWSRDQPPKKEHNLYGCHPFFLALETDGNAYGVFLLNSSAMEVDIKPGDPPILTYTVSGGILDLYIFTGPSPIEVVQQYQEVIGFSHLPPYWALGFHLSRWGYDSVTELNKTIDANRRAAICYESQWTDIDMMKDRQSWTFSHSDLVSTVHNLQLNGQRYVNIINPGVALDKSLFAYREGLAAGIFIKNHSGTRPLVGKVWPGEVVYPDFSHPHIYDYWYSCAYNLYKDIPFDGLWLDMNEPANFVSGCIEDCSLTASHPKDQPLFVPKRLTGKSLFNQTICPSARQHLGLHFDLHNLYGHMQLVVTNKVCRALKGKRTLLISRSTFPGSGHYGGHWTGDNCSTFTDLANSISAVLDFNLFGIPLVGADVGGFFNTCSEELLIRWMQLGAFYPFMRNHNSHPTEAGVSEPQDPGSYSKDTQAILADIVAVRYSLLPYLYTLMYDSHTKGAPVVRPLFMLYPKDKKTYVIDEQFMWGSTLLLSPCLREGETSVSAYFPYDIWYDFFTGERLTRVGTTIQLPTPLHSTNIHLRGGSILVTQTPARSTKNSRNNPFGLLAALDSNHIARGKLYWDDGEILDPVQTKQYNLIRFSVEEGCLTTTIDMLGYTKYSMKLKLVQIFGLYVPPERVLVNNRPASFTFTEDHRVLQLDKLDVSLMEPLSISWS